jgi:uncharacterized protein YjbJ (UPF0337 family)
MGGFLEWGDFQELLRPQNCSYDLRRIYRSRGKGRQQMKDSSKDQVQGVAHEAKGKIKEKLGRMTNNPQKEAEGQDEKIGGKIQKKIGQVEKVFEK